MFTYIKRFLINSIEQYKARAFLKNAEQGNTLAVREYIQTHRNNPAQINVRDTQGNTALMRAIQKGCTITADELLTEEAINVHVKNNAGDSALTLAASHGNYLLVDRLLDKPDIDVNSANNKGNTALIAATRNKHLPAVNMLLRRHDIKVNVRNRNNYSALMIAALESQYEFISSLLEHPDIDVNFADDFGHTALILAAATGNYDSVELLLRRPEINIHIRNHVGLNAEVMARYCGHSELATLIAEYTHIREAEEAMEDHKEQKEIKPDFPSQPIKPSFQQRIDQINKKTAVQINISEHYICPISQMLMNDPITLSTGHTYDRSSLIQWAKQFNQAKPGQFSCPLSRTLVPLTELEKSTTWFIHGLIEEFVTTEERKAREAKESKLAWETKTQKSAEYQASEKKQNLIRTSSSQRFQFSRKSSAMNDSQPAPEAEEKTAAYYKN